MAKTDPWSPSGIVGSPRRESPAFQREWKTLSSSAVELPTATTVDLTLAPSSSTYEGTIYIWGFTFVTPTNSFAAMHLEDEDGLKYGSAIATQNGPFFIAFDTPIKVTKNSKLIANVIAGQTGAYVTPFYTIMRTKKNG